MRSLNPWFKGIEEKMVTSGMEAQRITFNTIQKTKDQTNNRYTSHRNQILITNL